MTLTFVPKVVLTSEISCCTLTNVRITIYTVKCVWTFLTMRCKGNIFRITPNVINQNSILQYRWFIPTSHSMLRSTSKGLIKAKGWKDASRHNRIQNCMRYYVHIFNMYYTLLRVYFFYQIFLITSNSGIVEKWLFWNGIIKVSFSLHIFVAFLEFLDTLQSMHSYT